ncbi:4-(cytidine 5'-diphospho)-2-C-methyl-D-erythritol kinase [Eisenibacter elegans]|uniref:4-(cytidine 5'-diphospho)-2-C-methyl-D-erythritol kinase n=1 Tax=Eisenibacter elegans TaxID=997 RepID=UPI0003F758E0|nr:4-(cytidine 5'-diphospho)-2-C-methyl-D-erythritol kinase [Eisenibacter elegans]
MIDFPNIKINIGLDIIQRRADGYHDIASCFYPVAWSDVLEIVPLELQEETRFEQSGLAIPPDGQQNLCLRAYQLVKQHFFLPPVAFHLHKKIPVGAGLGGGSADAAFALKMLNTMLELELSAADLIDFARKLGSDCAFFIPNSPQYCTQKGDVFEPIALPQLQGKHILLVYPNLHISTAQAYAGVQPQAPTINLQEALKAPLAAWKDIVKNDFEPGLFERYPLLSQLKTQLYDVGAVYASMSGSGSTIYGIFEGQPPSLDFPENYHTWQGLLG